MSSMSEQRIANFISGTILDGRQVTPSDELLMSGLLDSLAVMTLVAHLETEMQVEIPADKITFENFSSVQNVMSLLRTL